MLEFMQWYFFIGFCITGFIFAMSASDDEGILDNDDQYAAYFFIVGLAFMMYWLPILIGMGINKYQKYKKFGKTK